ncbi:TetR family transcriptional regulator [Streptomyces sp. NPDC060334]|uniref:TetR family transcriptional regulator n=1 Tax=unclassified Streptomyces TaxID=2593676 RepID=UPI0006AFD770|nr:MULTISPECIES: TetR family transcriptional regulator [unclassified Streptomyces]KOU42546.1 TetR family transcriptional regulator [Streptomyces sp. WM4235]MCX5075511.1 TetR family transcriptional regulator [Streptomyces sp. NBC_00424]MCX5152868.1 TetR family transcriptional regulator [Streptomyces sp. NBC_00291]WUD41383.1 TetR family transcriptional regulator [Streptomyces sp. NBC_00513]
MPPAAAEPLTPERILETTEDVLRRFGPTKATVVDVARALGVSHGSVYRHFPSKAALREAVTDRWLAKSIVMLEEIASAPAETAPSKLEAWLEALFEAKRKKAGADPELFATYTVLLAENSGVVDRHLSELIEQLVRIIADGVEAGTLAAPDVPAAARAVFDATGRFHDPQYAADWLSPTILPEFEAVTSLVIRGLRA